MHVVIVGGGFAGVRAARLLGRDNRFKVTLISARSNFEYHAALYRSATGRSPLEVVIPLKTIFRGYKNVKLVNDHIETIDATQRTVLGTSKQVYKYDELVLATGVVDADFGIKGLKEYAFGIRSIAEAMRLKKHLHDNLTVQPGPDLNYVVVGAGPTGVELASELVSYLSIIRRRHQITKGFQVSLVEAAPRILPALPAAFSRRMEKRLVSLGVKIYASTKVQGATAATLQLPEGNIKTHTIVWTAGIANNPLFKRHAELFNFGKAGRVSVEGLKAAPHIWVVGDSADTIHSGLASTAVYDGEYIAKSLKAQIQKQATPDYQPPVIINAIPAGPGWCGVHFQSRNIYGAAGWAVRRWADLRLYRSLLPTGLATKTWLMGNRLDEECKICRRSLR